MSEYVASQIVKLMLKKDLAVKKSKLLLLGITFKENCPDVRNTKVVDVVKSLTDYGIYVTIYDPWAKKDEVQNEYNLEIINTLPNETFDAIVLAVAHGEFLNLDFEKLKNKNAIIYDVKSVLKITVDGKL